MNRRTFTIASVSYALMGRRSLALQEDVETVRYNISKQVVQGFRQDKPAAVKNLLATSFADATSNEQVRITWARTVGILGPFSAIGAQSTRVAGPYTLTITKLLFAKGHADLRITFDSGNAITGLFIVPVGDHSADDLEASARLVVDELSKGQFQAVTNRFDDYLKPSLDTRILTNGWNNLIAANGAFVKQLAAQKLPESDAVDVRCKFSINVMVVRIEFSPSLTLVALNFLPAT